MLFPPLAGARGQSNVSDATPQAPLYASRTFRLASTLLDAWRHAAKVGAKPWGKRLAARVAATWSAWRRLGWV